MIKQQIGTTKLQLHDSRWQKFSHGFMLGSAFIGEEIVGAENIATHLQGVGIDDLATFLLKLNGRWSLIFNYAQDKFVVCTDRTRTHPLFYGQSSAGAIVSDMAEDVRAFVGDESVDSYAVEEFLHTSVVTGRDTLYANVKQMQTGEILNVDCDKSAIDIHRWYTFHPSEPTQKKTLEEYIEELDVLNIQAHERLIKYAEGRPIFVPLSGGLDSRTVAMTLKRLKYDNLHCFSYGGINAPDPLVAKDVAKKLGIPWHYVPYTKKMWREEFQKDYFQDFLKKYFNYSITPNPQDFPSIAILYSKGILSQNAVLAPGQCDLFFGSNALPPQSNVQTASLAELANRILQTRYNKSHTPLSGSSEDWQARVGTRLDTCKTNFNEYESNGLFEQWLLQEYTAKFYTSSTLAFTFWGYDQWHVLCDNNLLDFWGKLPQEFRYNRTLQLAYVSKFFAQIIGESDSALKTDRDRTPPVVKQAPTRSPLRKYVPDFIKHIKRHLVMHSDVWGFHYAFPFSFRHACVKEGNLNIDYIYSKYLIEKYTK